jgi:hypothetical protein
MAGNVADTFVSKFSRDRKREVLEAPRGAKETPFLSPSSFALSTAFFFYWSSYHLAQKTLSSSEG